MKAMNIARKLKDKRDSYGSSSIN